MYISPVWGLERGQATKNLIMFARNILDVLEFTLKAGTLHLGSRFVSPHIATMAATTTWSLDNTLDLDLT